MKKSCVALIALLLVNNMLGMDGLEWLKKHRILDSFEVTSTGLVLKFHSFVDDKWRIGLVEGSFEEGQFKPYKEMILTSNQEARLVKDGGHVCIIIKSVSFKSQHKGFRINPMIIGASVDHTLKQDTPSETTYIVLSDTPMTMGEDDVEMVMDYGEWVKAEDSRSLEIEKLGYTAETWVCHQKEVLQDAECLGYILNDPRTSKLWHTLIERGFIKVSAEEMKEHEANARIEWEKRIAGMEDARAWLAEYKMFPPYMTQEEAVQIVDKYTQVRQDEDEEDSATVSPPSRNNFWLYVGIVFSLCAIFYFLQRKLKTSN
jgi:hypothetical protein